jgi:hypothetical protein
LNPDAVTTIALHGFKTPHFRLNEGFFHAPIFVGMRILLYELSRADKQCADVDISTMTAFIYTLSWDKSGGRVPDATKDERRMNEG